MRRLSAELSLICVYPRSSAAKLPGPGLRPSLRLGYVYEIQPLLDTRWDRFVKKHADSSVFHTTAWLDALYRTYGYRPVVYTDAPPGCELASGVPFCHVDSWLTGRRLVSVPFSDHCDPLVSGTAD